MAKTIIEFDLSGKPASVNGCKARKDSWKAQVQSKVMALYTGGKNGEKFTVKIFYFPHNEQYCDIDNGLKYTIDGMASDLMDNDKTVTRIITERFPKIPGASLIVPLNIAPQIAQVIKQREISKSPVYLTLVKVEEYDYNGGSLW
ncbi:RusA family crossover junction endodeoxyribonuclease [Atlantibacter subterraneus]|uniref:RusA family crossover junction endodeoxyribonuclease n=1 Tax=Atlantibacter subterraneus TaxID=255519 RepID=UPI0028B15122|nr:RusA family crossover junction endodeoxyribonuclease [Atlantibacter subterranea]